MLLEGLEGTLLLAATVALWPLARPLLIDLGARPDEITNDWPGDGLLERVDRSATRGVTVGAPAAAVWPWLQQFGLDRGGFHSYELLERLGGIDVRNVEELVPELQNLPIGTPVPLHPSGPPLIVTLVEPERHLCMRTWLDERDVSERDPEQLATFSLYLTAEGPERCRLIVRTCKQLRRRRGTAGRLLARLFEEPLDLVMERRMLRTIRRLAERDGT